jgi:hypothetical protein
MRVRPAILLLLGLLLTGMGVMRAAEESAPRAEARIVKAAYIYNLTKFVDWAAADAKSDRLSPFTIAVLGRDLVASTLTENSPAESLGRPLRVVQVARGEKIPPCHLLYIALSEAPRLAVVFEEIDGSGVLTVSDIPRFVETGGMIGFAVERGRVRIEINVPNIRAAGLTVSSKLLEIARPTERTHR